MKPIISPSILSADFGYLARDIEMINESEAEWVHIDIMDGVFVPNISFGFPVLKYVAKLSQKPLDVHLMIVHPKASRQALPHTSIPENRKICWEQTRRPLYRRVPSRLHYR